MPSIAPGTWLGHYQVLGPIGAGWMGEVYRARDTRLVREVALKVIPPVVAADGERLARFEREAHLLASLNHPHIAAIYGVEDAGGAPALVLETPRPYLLADILDDRNESDRWRGRRHGGPSLTEGGGDAGRFGILAHVAGLSAAAARAR